MVIRIQNKSLGEITINLEGVEDKMINFLTNLMSISDLPKIVNQILDEREYKKNEENIIQMPQLLEMLKPLGFSKSTISKWIMKAKRGDSTFPFYKKGRKLIFHRDEIQTWLRSR